jgi:lipopolysaccharide transport system ATP-binding protein
MPGVVHLAAWPSPLVLAELIARSEAVIGHSYHLLITALVSGVPVFTRQNLSTGKYSALQRFETIFGLPSSGEPDIEWFLERLGRKAPSATVRATNGPLDDHWNRIAAAIQTGPAPTAPSPNRFWQSLPALLEDAATREDKAVGALQNGRVEAGTAPRNGRIAEIMASISSRLTAPARFVGRRLQKNGDGN